MAVRSKVKYKYDEVGGTSSQSDIPSKSPSFAKTMGHVLNLYITFAALFTLIIPSVIATGANWDSGKTSDFFLYPEQREKLPAQKLAPADGDTIQAIWVQSTEQSAFEFVCCEPEEEACGSERSVQLGKPSLTTK